MYYLSIDKELELNMNPENESITFWKNLIINETSCGTETNEWKAFLYYPKNDQEILLQKK